AEDGIRDDLVTGVQTCALPISVSGWCVIPSAFTAELMGRAGYDWVCIDTQHGLIGYDQMLPMLQALSATGTPAFVRVPWNQPAEDRKSVVEGKSGDDCVGRRRK